MGTARMSDDPKKGVVNKWSQSHDVKNLFITDASVFVSAGWQNPTITMCALATVLVALCGTVDSLSALADDAE